MSTRRRLPDRRRSETFSFVNPGDNLHYVASASYFADGRLAEIFVTNHRGGSHADHAAKDSAILASIALQFGAPLEVLRGAVLRDDKGRPVTAIGAALDVLAEGSS